MDQYAVLSGSYEPPAFIIPIDLPIGKESTVTQYVFSAPAPKVSKQLVSSSGQKIDYQKSDSPILKGLERLRAMKGWGQDWDTEGSLPPSASTIDAATKVLGLLADFTIPKISISSEGLPMFLINDKMRGEVVVTSPDRLEYYFDNTGEYEAELPFDGKSLPQALIEHLRALA